MFFCQCPVICTFTINTLSSFILCRCIAVNCAFLRCKYGADFDTSVHTLFNCINVYHELDESHCSILNVLGELLDCKSESSYIDCLNPEDIDCMVYCILTQ